MKSFYKVIVAGSRDFDDYLLLKSSLDRLFLPHVQETLGSVIIVSGAAKGADTLGEQWAKERSCTCTRFPAQWDRYGKKAGIERNIEMAEYANCLVAFWDGESPGTKHMIAEARNRRLETHIYFFEKDL